MFVCDFFFFFTCLYVAIFRKAALLFGWAVFLLLAYKVSKLDREYQEYNPYEVLNLDPVNTHTKHKIFCILQSPWNLQRHLFIFYLQVIRPIICMR